MNSLVTNRQTFVTMKTYVVTLNVVDIKTYYLISYSVIRNLK